MTINPAGLKIIEECEGCRLEAYQDQKGIWTIGYGHTPASPGQTITQIQAEDLLEIDLMHAENCIAMFVHVSLNPNQFSALTSLVFNCGTAPLFGGLGRFLNQADYIAAAEEFIKWAHCNGILVPGLLERRKREKELFLT